MDRRNENNETERKKEVKKAPIPKPLIEEIGEDFEVDEKDFGGFPDDVGLKRNLGCGG